jgi:outer membrane receptor protein involved in Fe transport
MPEIIGSVSSDRAYLGFSAFKASFSGRYNLSESTTLYAAANYQSKFESSHIQGDGLVESKIYLPMTIVNVGVIFRPVKLPNLYGQLGVNNLLDIPYMVASPYVGDLQDLPMLARQFSISLTYRLK